MSGAMTSMSGPMKGIISMVKRRVRRSSSPGDMPRGSQAMPPLPPPKGRSISAHFQVIQMASAVISPRSTRRMVTQAALDRAAGEVVLDAVAEEDLGAAVIAADRHGDGDPAFRPLAALAQIVVEIEEIGDLVELFGRHGKHRVFQKIVAHERIQARVGRDCTP